MTVIVPAKRRRITKVKSSTVLTKIHDGDTWKNPFSLNHFIPPWGIIAIRRLDLPDTLKTIIAEYAVHDEGVIDMFANKQRFVTKPISYWSAVRKLLVVQPNIYVPKKLTIKWCISHLCTHCQKTIGAYPHLITNKRVCRQCQQLHDIQPIHTHHAYNQYFLNYLDIRHILHPNSAYVYLKDIMDIAIQKHTSMDNIKAMRKVRQQDIERIERMRKEHRARQEAARQRRLEHREQLLRRELTRTLRQINSYIPLHGPETVLTVTQVWENALCVGERDAYIRWGHTSNMHLSKSVEVARYLYVRARNRSAGEYYQFIKRQMNWAQTVRYLHHVRLGIYCDRCRLSYAERNSKLCQECRSATS